MSTENMSQSSSGEPTRICPECGQEMIRMWHDWRSDKASWRCDNGHVQFSGGGGSLPLSPDSGSDAGAR